MKLLDNSQTNWKYILIVVILAVVVIGVIYWQYQEMQQKEFEGIELNIPEKEKVCSSENPENCDRGCKADEDCTFPCSVGFCINKNQEFPKSKEVCGVFFCECIGNTCEEVQKTF